MMMTYFCIRIRPLWEEIIRVRKKDRSNVSSAVPPFLSKRKTGDIEDLLDGKEPRVVLDSDANVFLIEGESNMQNAREFYTEVLVWLGMYGKMAAQQKIMNVRLYDFNASSALYLSKVFDLWVNFHAANSIVWHYNPEDDWEMESGEIFRDLYPDQLTLIADSEMPLSARNDDSNET